jgi:hypothetical protein
MSFKVGDVVRYTRVWSTDIHDDPAWFLITDASYVQGTWLSGGGFKAKEYAAIPPGGATLGGIETPHVATREVVPPEEWPDHICALVAKHALLDGFTKGDG